MSVAFAPDGRTLASGSGDETIRLWDLDLERVRTRACETLSRNLSASDWRRYFGDEPPLKTCPRRPIHPSFFEPGDALAWKGKLEEAIAEYQRVLDQFGSRELDPGGRARRLAAPWKWDAAVDLAWQGHVASALAAYAQAKEWDPSLWDKGTIEEGLCRAGSLWGRAADVLAHCQRAVELDPFDPQFQYSRALARAQTGDLAGAIEDFRAFVAWAEAGEDMFKKALTPPKLRQWIQSLEQGKNPFDAATLEALRRDEP